MYLAHYSHLPSRLFFRFQPLIHRLRYRYIAFQMSGQINNHHSFPVSGYYLSAGKKELFPVQQFSHFCKQEILAKDYLQS